MLFDAQQRFYDHLLAAGQGKDDDLLEWLPEQRRTTTKEAGSKGGRTVRERFGPDHFVGIGKLGGEVTRRKGAAHYSALGKLGGAATKQKRGPDYYAALGRKGGASTAKRGYAYFSQIGQLGGQASRRSKGQTKTERQEEG